MIGSGPVGIASAKALLKRGFTVTLFDVGLTRESARKFGNPLPSQHGLIPKKKLFDSTYMYQRADGLNFKVSKNTSFDTSHAKGGLSTVWGSTVGAIYPPDIAGWPFNYDDLSQHLNTSFEFTGVMGRADQVDDLYPLNFKVKNLPYETDQTKFILDKVEKNKDFLNNAGIFVGKSKLAIQADADKDNVCIMCNQCMKGCEYGSIYSAANELEVLRTDKNFNYQSLSYVERFSETQNVVTLEFRRIAEKELKHSLKFNAAIIAAGCIDTLRLIHNSIEKRPEEFVIRDSQKFYFPVFVWKKKQLLNAKTISLAHIYLQTFDANGNLVQTQLYPGLEIINSIVMNVFGSYFGGGINKFLNPIFSRLYIGMTYYHSNVSGLMRVKFLGDNVLVQGVENRKSVTEFRLLIKKLISNGLKMGFFPFPFLYLKAKIGHSQHFGSALPISDDVQSFGVNSDGRLHGFDRVFISDSSVLPSIPATPTTTIAVLNATRNANLFNL